MTDEEITALESVANTLRGMGLDPRIPTDARDVLTTSAGVIDAITEDDELADWGGEGGCPKCQGDGCDPEGGCVYDD